MHVFNLRFFGGTCVVAIGLLSAAVGLFSCLPPTNNIVLGIVLLLAGIALVKFGFIIAKDLPAAGSKVAINTLHRAKMIDKTRKK